jgi:hypothetical protein
MITVPAKPYERLLLTFHGCWLVHMYEMPLLQTDAWLGSTLVTPSCRHDCIGFVKLALPGQLQLDLQQAQ